MTANVLAIVLASGENGLGAGRSLARARVPVLAVALSAQEPVLYSRYPRKCVVRGTGDPDSDLLRALQGIAPGPAVVIPTSDYFVHFLAAHRSRLCDRWRLAAPSNEVLSTFRDKATEARVISATGIPVPRTAREIPPAAPELIRELGLPIILKPRTVEDKKRIKLKTLVANSAEELEAIYQRHRSDLTGLLAQECVPGADDTLWVCDCVFDRNSELVTAFTFKKISTAPAHFGVTSLGISERNDELLCLVAELGKKLGYVGPADVDFKYDARDGRYKYLEINPRLGMCNYFATQCGMNCAVDAYRVALELPPLSRGKRQTDGAVYLDLHDDVHSRIRDGDGLVDVLRTYSGLLGRKRVGPFFSWGDPQPGLRAAWCHILRWARAVRRRLFPNRHTIPNPTGEGTPTAPTVG